MLRLIVLRGVRAHKNVAQRRLNVLYSDRNRVVEPLLQLENKLIVPNNLEIQHKHMYTLYIGSLCKTVFPMSRFTCIVTSQVFVKI